MTATADLVRQQYERQPYPLPETDLDRFARHKDVVTGSPLGFYHLFWPCETVAPAMDILIAGCGTSQAAKYALAQPQVNIVAIDISSTSLDHTQQLIDKYRLENVTLHQLPIERVGELGETFDLIVSTGMLHHTPDPDQSLAALRAALRQDGAMHVMVYGRYGRSGLAMMQAYCQLLDITADDTELEQLQQVIGSCPADHPIQPLVRRSKDVGYAAGLADMFLHPCERGYSVPQIYEWLAGAGMSMCRWFYQAPYWPQGCPLGHTAHAERLASLPAETQHAAVELFRGHLHKHEFICCRDDRPNESYEIDLEGDDWRRLVPLPFCGATVKGNGLPDGVSMHVVQSGHQYPVTAAMLDENQARLYDAMNGRRTIGEVAAASDIEGDADALEEYAQRIFRLFWRFDLVCFGKLG